MNQREHTAAPPPPWWAYGGTRCAIPGCGRTLHGAFDILAHQREHAAATEQRASCEHCGHGSVPVVDGKLMPHAANATDTCTYTHLPSARES